ncbi:MAG: ATP-binding cassette domain-containing protein [Planctomycetes bacterium]|nr:ATP-binding cassette domain-containing protein [Planctomycetota bacterium]
MQPSEPVNAPPALVVRGLVRRYGARAALDGLDLEVPEGSLFGLLGPNGAGKSTLLRLVLGLARPDAGAIAIFGRDVQTDPVAALEPVGALVDGPALHAHLSARENLRCFALLCGGLPDAELEALLERVGLLERADDKVGGFSYGMRMRLGLALALLRRPRLLLLDEPTDGLDPAGVQAVRAFLRELQRTGTTIVLSSHLLGEIEAVCDRAVIVVRGRVIASGTMAQLTSRGSLEQRFLELTKQADRGDGFAAPVVPPIATPRRGSFLGAWRSELLKLVRARVAWTALALAIALALFGALRAPEAQHALAAPRNGFTALASGMAPVNWLLAALALIGGATAIAGETQDGTLRSALARPLPRGSLLAGKAASLATQLAAVQLAALLAALLAAGVTLGFASPLDARELDDPLQSAAFGADALRASALLATLSGFLAAIAVGMLGFVVSTIARRSPDAILQAALSLAVLVLLGEGFALGAERALCFPSYLGGTWQHLLELGEKRVGAAWCWGNSALLSATGDLELDRARAAWLSLCVPAGSALLLGTIAWAIFRARDVRA